MAGDVENIGGADWGNTGRICFSGCGSKDAAVAPQIHAAALHDAGQQRIQAFMESREGSSPGRT